MWWWSKKPTPSTTGFFPFTLQHEIKRGFLSKIKLKRLCAVIFAFPAPYTLILYSWTFPEKRWMLLTYAALKTLILAVLVWDGGRSLLGGTSLKGNTQIAFCEASHSNFNISLFEQKKKKKKKSILISENGQIKRKEWSEVFYVKKRLFQSF